MTPEVEIGLMKILLWQKNVGLMTALRQGISPLTLMDFEFRFICLEFRTAS